jgi:hypothetical protein
MTNMCFAETLVSWVMGMVTILGTMVFMPLMKIVSVFK